MALSILLLAGRKTLLTSVEPLASLGPRASVGALASVGVGSPSDSGVSDFLAVTLPLAFGIGTGAGLMWLYKNEMERERVQNTFYELQEFMSDVEKSRQPWTAKQIEKRANIIATALSKNPTTKWGAGIFGSEK